ncbi:ABC transporter ATP-binding protein [Pelosinus propionicus]|uniref:ATP-binding cassette, subfamily B n=1 Tax=Pelosinus propionicus DSM 13327 TaxID=1123291 RepID=A0A1I4PQQ2_9FIRM|nr:ABC transporter ATP-binding protein [Pelosinus propionicus]SFM30044.1 ATP-binding cassette, subfamily B [Pelosinus propionicus DSM 13327]
MKIFSHYKKKYGAKFFLAVFFVMCETICDLILPAILSQIIDVGIAGKNMEYVLLKGGLMLFITALGAIAASARNVISSTVSQKFGTELRLDLYKKIQTLSLENIEHFDKASLVTRLTNDVTQIQTLVNGLMRIFIKGPFLCVGSLIMAIQLNAKLASILAVVIPIVGMLIFMNMKMGFPLFIKVQQVLDQLNGVMREYLSGVRVVKAFNRFDYEVEKFNKVNQELQLKSVKAMRIISVFGPGIMLTVNFGIVIVLWFGGKYVHLGEMQAGHIIAFINYMTQILFSLLLISMVFNMFVRAKASTERVNEVFSQVNTMKWDHYPRESTAIKGRVDFQNVYFSYGKIAEEAVLKNVTMTCLPGERIGIIGSTGSGKSSLIQLIPRFYDVTSGSVKVNGEDVKDVNPKWIREKMGIVPQQSILFTGTVLDNIKWGRENATAEEIETAARIAQAHDFIIALPEGYQTKVGQGGVNFSGGQKQRIAIARAIVRKPEILILDDATSAVDVLTEEKIKEALKQYAEKLTCLIVAQRIVSVMDLDRIIVLDQGEIVGVGKHSELMESSEVYREIFYSQIGKEM